MSTVMKKPMIYCYFVSKTEEEKEDPSVFEIYMILLLIL